MSLHDLRFLLAQAPAAPQTMPNPTGESLKMLIMMGGLMVAFWLFVIRPQSKRAKELEATISALRPGDKIVTNSGIVGVVLSLKDKNMMIRSGDTKLEVLKSAVAEVKKDSVEATSS
jgi:preprotein translocase subunit YajC